MTIVKRKSHNVIFVYSFTIAWPQMAFKVKCLIVDQKTISENLSEEDPGFS